MLALAEAIQQSTAGMPGGILLRVTAVVATILAQPVTVVAAPDNEPVSQTQPLQEMELRLRAAGWEKRRSELQRGRARRQLC